MKTIKEKRKEGKFTRKRNKFTKRTISPIVLVAFFVYTIIPLPIKAAECVDWDGDGWGWDGEKGCKMSEEVTLKAPTTSNKKAEEVRDGINLTNTLPAIIPQETTKQCIDTDGDGWGWDGEKGCRVEKKTETRECKPTKNTATNGGWGWDGEKGCQVAQTNLEERTPEVSVNNSQNNNLNPETDNSTLNNTILNLLNYANNFMTSVVSGAFASQPFNQTTLALLFNNSSYITLRKKAEEDKKNKLKDLNKARNNKLNSLKKNYQALVQKLKDSFQKKKTALQLRKQNILNRLQQTTNRINSIQTGLKKVKFLKQKLASLLNNFNYAQSQESSHYALYLQEKKEKEHNKKKYKKYKKKYKKKHKKKYKKRYKKYKKRYKKHKKRAQNEKNSWQYFANLKRSKAREYDQVRQEIASLENQQRELSSLTGEKSALEWETDTLAKLEKEQLTKEEQILNSSLASALNSYESSQQEIDNEYINSLGIAEEEYQKELKKTEVYQEKIDTIFNDNGLIFLTKGEREEVLKQLNQKLNQEKEIVKSRIGSRYAYLENLAQEIRNAIANNAQEALEIVNQKVALAYTAFLKVKSKTKKDRHKYEDRKDIEKKAKKYAKKYKKYLKKAEKYKRKGNHKKYKKYLSKAQSKLKKYEKYSKKLAKYGGTTKHYKEGFKALEDLVKQYEKQYQQTLQEQQRARQTYTTILQQADSKQQSLLSLAQKERARELNKLDQAGVDYYQFNKVGIYQEIDLNSYFQGIATISLSGGIMGAEAGLQTAKSITKQISKISHKIKKKYKKAVKKAKKKEEEKRQRYLAQRRYYQQQVRRRARAIQNTRTAGVWFDANGNGYSGYYSKEEGYFKTPPVKTTTWKTTYSAPVKKSWWEKAKEIGGKVKDWAVGELKHSWNDFKKHPIKTTLNAGVNSLKWFPPVLAARGMGKAVGWIGNKWYTEYKEQDSVAHKVRYVLDQTGDVLGIASGALYATGIGAPVALALDAVGGVFDLGAAAMYAVDGDWKNVGIKALSIIPAMGSGVAFARQGFKIGKPAAKLIQETAKTAKLRETYAPFADNVYSHFSGMVRNSDIPKGFEVMGKKNLKMAGFAKDSMKVLESSKGAIYINEKTKELVLAFSGTRIDKFKHFASDIKDSAVSNAGMVPENYKLLPELAKDIQSKFPGFSKVISAHSKGADSATVVSGLTGIKSTLFNPKSVNGKFLSNMGIKVEDAEKTVQYFIQQGDLLQELRKMTLYSPKGIGHLVGPKTLLDEKTFTLSALLGKWLNVNPLAKHGDIFKSLTK
jgi:hypothetical protein